MKSLEFINQIDEILLRVSQITDIKDILIYPELLLNIRPCNRIAHRCKPVIRSIVIYVTLSGLTLRIEIISFLVFSDTATIPSANLHT